MRSLNSVLITACLLCFVSIISSEGILDKLKNDLEDTKDMIQDSADKVCIMDEGCNTAFLNFNNYCCTLTCCNMFEYISKNDNYWDNLVHTFSVPRAINIIIIVGIIILLASFIGIIVKLICCFCCCCGSKKYVIVGNN